MKIKCAAIQGIDGSIVEGRSHADAYKAAHPDENFRRAVCGFVTDTGLFVDRKEGGRIAFEAGQTPKLETCLFSEDLTGDWPWKKMVSK
jgi:hypothetical protein